VIEISSNYAVINRSLGYQQNNTVLMQSHGHPQFAKLLGQVFMTDYGDVIEGDALDYVNMVRILVFFINRTV